MGLFDLQHQAVDPLMLEAPMGIVLVVSQEFKERPLKRLRTSRELAKKDSLLLNISENNMPSS